MKNRGTITVFFVLGFVLIAYFILDPMQVPIQELDVPVQPSPKSAPTTSRGIVDGSSPEKPDLVARTPDNRSGSSSQDEVLVEYGEFVPVKEYRRDCSRGIHLLGGDESELIETCTRRFEFDHSYADFTDSQLSQIAQNDGQAAFLLAHRQLIDPSEGQTQDIEAGLNNVISAIIHGGGQQAFSLLLDEKVFSPYQDNDSFFLWSYVGSELGLLADDQEKRLRMFSSVTANIEYDRLRERAIEIANRIRSQRLIVTGTEF